VVREQEVKVFGDHGDLEPGGSEGANRFRELGGGIIGIDGITGSDAEIKTIHAEILSQLAQLWDRFILEKFGKQNKFWHVFSFYSHCVWVKRTMSFHAGINTAGGKRLATGKNMPFLEKDVQK